MKKTISIILCACLLISVLPSSLIFAASPRPSYLFAIDAGHGGTDPGCTGYDGRYECNDNIKIAQEVINLLESQGQRTYLIDRNLKTQDRPVEANNINADFLISLHRDSSTSSSVSGINIYTHDSTHYQQIAQPTKVYAPNEHADKHTLDEILVNSLYDNLSSTGLLPVSLPHYGSASAPTWEDYFINRISNMPSCIIEYGFATNPNDNAVFDNNYKALALATVKALLNTVGLSFAGPFEDYSYPTIQDCGGQKYYVLNGDVVWTFSNYFNYDNAIYDVQNGVVEYYTPDTAGGTIGYSGNCSWLYADKKLQIFGRSDTANYSVESLPPWENDITEVTVQSGVTVLGTEIFKDSADLTTVNLPLSLTEIKDSAFENCTSIETVNYKGTREDFEKITIGNSNDALTTATINYICDIEGHKYVADCSTACSVCGEIRTTSTQHTYSNSCDETCDVCGETRVTEHTYSFDCDAVCDICGFERTAPAQHSFNASGICDYCGERRYIKGDVNGDFVIDVIDAARIRKHILKLETIDLSQNPGADVNGDGVVDVIDAARVRKHILKIELL